MEIQSKDLLSDNNIKISKWDDQIISVDQQLQKLVKKQNTKLKTIQPKRKTTSREGTSRLSSILDQSERTNSCFDS